MDRDTSVESNDEELGAILFRCGKRSLDEFMFNALGFPVLISVFLYIKVSFIALVFIGGPVIIGLGKLGIPTPVNLAMLIFLGVCSFGFFGYCLYIVPGRLNFYVCERGLLFRKGFALSDQRVHFDQIARVQLGDKQRGKKLLRLKHRMSLRIERHGDKPIKVEAFTASYKRESIDTLIGLLDEVSGFPVTRGNIQYNRG